MSWLLDMRPRGAGGGSSGAPADATYITQTPNATLTNEQALSALATGLLKNTTGTGVLSIGVPTVDFASALQGALADTALQPADIGVSVQAWDADLDTLAGLAKSKGNLIAGNGANWQGLSVGANGFALVADSLEATGLKWAAIVAGVSSVFGRTGAVVAALNDYPASFITNTPAGGIASTDVQGALNELDTEKAAIASLDNVAFTGAYADLSGLPTLGTLAALNSPLPVLNGGTGATTDSGARTNLGLGTIATQAANNVTISGGSITGIADLAIADGGTGQSTAQAAINALSGVAAATNEHVLTKDTATGNAVFKAAAGGSSLPVADTQTIIKGSVDPTKLLRWEIDGFTAGATRVMTPPNQDASIAGLEVAQTFTVDQVVSSKLAVGASSAVSTIASLAVRSSADAIKSIELLGNRPWIIHVDNSASFASGLIFQPKAASKDGGFAVIPSAGATESSIYLIANATPDTTGAAFFAFGGGFSGAVASSWNFGSVVYAQATGNSRPIDFTMSNTTGRFSAMQLANTGQLTIKPQFTGTTDILNALTLNRRTNGTPAAGFGVGLAFQGESSTTENQSMARFAAIWDVATHASRSAALQILISGSGGEVDAAKFDDDATAGNTRFLLYDVDNGQLERVSVGIADSGGAGFKVLRIPN